MVICTNSISCARIRRAGSRLIRKVWWAIAVFDVCQFVLNPRPVPIAVNRRRLDVFCDELDLDPQRTRQWCLVHALLNACWSFEDGAGYTARVTYAEENTLQF